MRNFAAFAAFRLDSRSEMSVLRENVPPHYFHIFLILRVSGVCIRNFCCFCHSEKRSAYYFPDYQGRSSGVCSRNFAAFAARNVIFAGKRSAPRFFLIYEG